MCNFKHNESIVPEKPDGTGWKIFREGGQTAVGYKAYQMKNGWAVWSNRVAEEECATVVNGLGLDMNANAGFCVIASLEDGWKALNDWAKLVRCTWFELWEVKYEQAIWEHVEAAFTGEPLHMLLVKKFKRVKLAAPTLPI